MNIYRCNKLDEFEQICTNLLAFDTKDVKHSRIEFDNHRPVVTARASWGKRIALYFERLFYCKCEHPAEVAARKVADFFKANKHFLSLTSITALQKMQDLKHAPKNSPRIASLLIEVLGDRLGRTKNALMNIVTRNEGLQGNIDQLVTEIGVLSESKACLGELVAKLENENKRLMYANDMGQLRLAALEREVTHLSNNRQGPPGGIAAENVDALEREALARANDEGAKIVNDALRQAQEIVSGAQIEAERIRKAAEGALATQRAPRAPTSKRSDDDAKKLSALSTILLTKFQNDTANMDVVIHCEDGQAVKIHSVVLQNRLPSNIILKLKSTPGIKWREVESKKEADSKEQPRRLHFHSKIVKYWIDYLYTSKYPTNLNINELLELYKLAKQFSPPDMDGTEVEGFATQIKEEIAAKVEADPQLHFAIIPTLDILHPALPFLMKSLNLYLTWASLNQISKELIHKLVDWLTFFKPSTVEAINRNPPYLNLTLGFLCSGLFNQREQDLKMAAQLFENAANTGKKENAHSITQFALCLISGAGRPEKNRKQDREKGLQYLELSAYHYSCAVAQYHCALLILNNKHGKKEEARILLERSAKQKYPPAIEKMEQSNKDGTWNSPSVVQADGKQKSENDLAAGIKHLKKVFELACNGIQANLKILHNVANGNGPYSGYANYYLARYSEEVTHRRDEAMSFYLNAHEKGCPEAATPLRKAGLI